jgi:hypothetical protein
MMVVMMMTRAIVVIVIAVRAVMMMVMMPPTVMVMVITAVIWAGSPRMSAMDHQPSFRQDRSMSALADCGHRRRNSDYGMTPRLALPAKLCGCSRRNRGCQWPLPHIRR